MQRRPGCTITEQVSNHRCQRTDIPGPEQSPRDAVLDHFAVTAHVRRYYQPALGHRLEGLEGGYELGQALQQVSARNSPDSMPRLAGMWH